MTRNILIKSCKILWILISTQLKTTKGKYTSSQQAKKNKWKKEFEGIKPGDTPGEIPKKKGTKIQALGGCKLKTY
ncbi:hypothetical protein CIPAW_06G115700 [Carya illinoinensis]|uniref:Uncharacterized protein n=1 Tax=Carya illinoinensis TaxID=32201 RepID=A0A8T1QAI2_CARIL|nr:hypothetical protein CIPAW_06G115700 [Carya illinoinensis]